MSRYGQLPPPHMRGHLCSLPIDNPPPTTLPTDPTERQKRLSRQKHKYRNEISPLNPDQFRPDFDVVEELRTNREAYTTPKGEDNAKATMYIWPNMCRMSTDLLRNRVSKSSPPGVQPTIACCINRGLEVLGSNSSIVKLLHFKERFLDTDTKKKGLEMLFVYEWFSRFVIELEGVGGTRQDVMLPIAIHGSLSDLSLGIGMSRGSIACVASMVAMSEQDQINKDHAKIMKETVGKILEKVSIRVRGTEALLKEFGL